MPEWLHPGRQKNRLPPPRHTAKEKADKRNTTQAAALRVCGHVQENQGSLNCRYQKDSEQGPENASATSENVSAAEHYRSNDYQFVAHGRVSLHRSQLRKIKHARNRRKKTHRCEHGEQHCCSRNSRACCRQVGGTILEDVTARLRTIQKSSSDQCQQRGCPHRSIQSKRARSP